MFNSKNLNNSSNDDSTGSSPFTSLACSSEQAQQQLDSTTKSKAQFNFGKCKVCKDKATGIHYGIATCEGCKGFFKRSIEKHHKYVCFFGYKCVITPNQRKRCKYCRWKCCLEAGMSFEGIKMGRISKSEKEKAQFQNDDSSTDSDIDNEKDQKIDTDSPPHIQTYKHGTSSFDVSDPLKLILNLNPSIALLKAFDPYTLIPKSAHSETFLKTPNENMIFVLSITKDKCYQLYREYSKFYLDCYEKTKNFIENENQNMQAFNSGHDQILENVWVGFCNDLSSYVNKLVECIPKLPGFDQLDIKDITTVINEKLFGVYGLAVTRLFINNEYYLILDGDIRINRYWMEKVVGLRACELIFDFHSKLNSFNLTDCELAILVPFVLSSEDIQISNNMLLNELKIFYTKVLLYEFNLNRRNLKLLNDIEKVLELTHEINILCKKASFQKINEANTV